MRCLKRPMTPEISEYLLVIAATAGFGGFVHGLMRRRSIDYKIVWPFHGSSQLGFLGDILVGIAAGTSIFFVMESAFGLRAEDLTKVSQAYLKFIALGVVSGYMGATLLDRLVLVFASQLVKYEQKLAGEEDELKKAQDRIKASSEAWQLIELADGYRRWGKYDEALDLYDQAIKIEPNNPHHYIQKSFVYANRAEKTKDKFLYEMAINLTNQTLQVDEKNARAYYDRACYKHSMGQPKEKVLPDLETAFKLNDYTRKMAKHDPDLKDFEQDEDFKKLVQTEIVKVA